MTLVLMTLGSLLFSFFRFFSYGVHQDAIWHTVGLHSGFVQIAANGWLENPVIQRALDVDDALLDSLRVPGVQTVAPRIQGQALASSKELSRFISVVAVSPEKEKGITDIYRKMKEGTYLTGIDYSDGSAEAILGDKLARYLELHVGDRFYLVGSQFDGSMGAIAVTLHGIFRAVDPELDSTRAFINLSDGRKIFAPGDPERGIIRYTSIGLGVENYRTARDVIRILEKKFPDPPLENGVAPEDSENYDPVVLDWKELNPGVIQMMLLDEIQNDFFYGFLVMILAFGILNNVQMSIHERTRELGILLAVGTRPGALHRMILAEVLFVLIPSLALGIGLGMALGWYFEAHPIVFGGGMGNMYEDMGFVNQFRAIVDPGEIWIAIVSLSVPALTLAMVAARRIFRLKPVEIINTL